MPDGSGAVVSQTDPGTGPRLAVLYISMANGAVYEVRPALGDDPYTFSWRPPAAADGE